MELHTCRICKGTDFEVAHAFKYGVRHYAHGSCGLQKWGAEFMDMIPQHEVGMLPWTTLDSLGLLDEAERRVKSANRTTVVV